MHVYRSVPSGLSAAAIAGACRDRPAAAGWAAGRMVIGVGLIAAVGAPLGLLWAVLGMALVVSAAAFVRRAGEWSMQTPALVLDSRPSWGGRRYTAWRLEAGALDDAAVDALIDRLRAALDGVAGPTVAVGDESTVRAAWGLGSTPDIDATATPVASRRTDASPGIWLRIDRVGPICVTFLAAEGPSTDALVDVASVIS